MVPAIKKELFLVTKPRNKNAKKAKTIKIIIYFFDDDICVFFKFKIKTKIYNKNFT